MKITIYAYDGETDEDGAFDTYVKDGLTDDQLREHAYSFTDTWSRIDFPDDMKRKKLNP